MNGVNAEVGDSLIEDDKGEGKNEESEGWMDGLGGLDESWDGGNGCVVGGWFGGLDD
jgi:hypothetical protein